MKLFPNKEEDLLWQWDTGRRLVPDAPATRGDFVCGFRGECLTVLPNPDGSFSIPDELLQQSGVLSVYLCSGEGGERHTTEEGQYTIFPRPKPADYIYTPGEVQRWEVMEAGLQERMETAMAGYTQAAANSAAAARGEYERLMGAFRFDPESGTLLITLEENVPCT